MGCRHGFNWFSGMVGGIDCPTANGIGDALDEWLNIGSAKGGTMEGPFVELVTHATSLIDVGVVG